VPLLLLLLGGFEYCNDCDAEAASSAGTDNDDDDNDNDESLETPIPCILPKANRLQQVAAES